MEYAIIENEKISQNYYKLVLDVPQGTRTPLPGQFYTVRCSETKDPLLRRPFSMHRLARREGSVRLEILYRVIGKGTLGLSRRQKGEVLDMIGPLGNGFAIDEGVRNIVLAARGIGIAPLYSIGEALRMRDRSAGIQILMGARIGERIFYEDECRAIGEVFLYTDDGSRGFHGRAPEFLVELIDERKLPEGFSLYACGPGEMLKELAEICERFSISGQVALEGHMACGFGACLSCVCPLKPHRIRTNRQWKKPALQRSEDETVVYSLICQDGPIYDIGEVDWDEWLA